MFPVSPILVLIYFIGYAALGLAIGALSGWLCSLIVKSGPGGIIYDYFLGLFGFFAGLFGCLAMPWPQNTISERLAGGGTMTSTMNRYQHPERVAIGMAILLPVLHEWYRSRRKRMVTD